jgi:hypothetical protein
MKSCSRAHCPIGRMPARALLISLLAASALQAHHSYAMFDTSQRVTIAGTVKAFQWTNPHCFIQLLVPTPGAANNRVDEWSIQMGAPAHLLRSGWTLGSVHPGDKLRVEIFPLRSGGKGGNFVAAFGADGRRIGNQP